MEETPNVPGQPNGSPVPTTEAEEESLNIGDFFSLCLNNWIWFVVSICVFLIMGCYYVLSTPKKYTRTASLIITDTNSGGMTPVADMMNNMGLFNTSSDVNNEIIAFQSPALISTVISRLGDNIVYTAHTRIKKVLQYKDSTQYAVDFLDLTDAVSATLTIDQGEGGSLEIDKFTLSGKKFPESITARMNDTLSTPIGRIVVHPGANYREDFEHKVTVSHMSLSSAIDMFTSMLKVELASDNASVINISMTDVSSARADDFIDTLIDVYNEKWVDDKNVLSRLTSKFIDERLAVIEHELGQFDENISEFKSNNLLPDLQSASEIYMRRSDENTRRELELNTQISIAQFLKDLVEATLADGGLIPANTGLENSGVVQQIAEYNKLQLERDRIALNSSDSNPLVIDYDTRLRSMRQAVVASLNNLIVTTQTQLKSVIKSDKSTNEAIASSPAQAKYLLSVERQQKVMETLYLFLLQKREENELTRSFTAFNTRILHLAIGSDKPTSPVTRNIIIVCLLLGLIVPAVILFIHENLDTNLRTRDDLKSLATPFVGEVPHGDIKGYRSIRERFRRFIARLLNRTYRDKSLPPLMVKEHGHNVINEAFRILRSNLEFMTAGKDHKVIMVTSFNPGSGKSFITLNLAAVMALKKKNGRVLAIDLDMRRASLSNAVGLGGRGVANYLAGSTDDYGQYIHEVKECPGLYVLPVGTIPPNPSELLYTDRFKNLIHNVRDEFDYVFIDCPPAEVVADAGMITKECDITLFVARAGLLDRRALPAIDEMYRQKRYTNMSFILNGTVPSGSSNRRYGSYGYGYGYGYGSNYYTKED